MRQKRMIATWQTPVLWRGASRFGIHAVLCTAAFMLQLLSLTRKYGLLRHGRTLPRAGAASFGIKTGSVRAASASRGDLARCLGFQPCGELRQGMIGAEA